MTFIVFASARHKNSSLKHLFYFVSDSGLAENFYFEELFSLYHDVCEEQMLDPEEGMTFLDFRKVIPVIVQKTFSLWSYMTTLDI
jgi:hypothetical protein